MADLIPWLYVVFLALACVLMVLVIWEMIVGPWLRSTFGPKGCTLYTAHWKAALDRMESMSGEIDRGAHLASHRLRP